MDVPPLLQERLREGTPVAIVDTNNPAELPENVARAAVHSVIDHHKLSGLTTIAPTEVDIRPTCSAGSIVYARLKAQKVALPPTVAGLLLSCILSDSLKFRSPTTTEADVAYARELAVISSLDIDTHAAAMLDAKSDVSDLSAGRLVMYDSKVYPLSGFGSVRVSVLESTSPAAVARRAPEIRQALERLASTQGVDHAMMFIIDILGAKATFIGASDEAAALVARAFDVEVDQRWTATLPGVLSRKKQIMPALERATASKL